MNIINFAHPISQKQREQIERYAGQAVTSIIDVKTQFDAEKPFASQLADLFDSVGLSNDQWQTIPILVNLPSLGIIAAMLIAELHGRCGHFPAVIRLRPVNESGIQSYEVAEIVNLQSIRDFARTRRK